MDVIWKGFYVALIVLAVLFVIAWRKRIPNFEKLATKVMLVGTLLALVAIAYDAGYMFGGMSQYFVELTASKNDEDNLQRNIDTLSNSLPTDLSENDKQWATQVEAVVRTHQPLQTWQADWPIPLAIPLAVEALVGLLAILKIMDQRKTR